MPGSHGDLQLVAPSPTPFRDDDSVDFEAIARNVERWLKTPLTGFVLNSENGEETFLSESERLDIVRTVHQVAGQQKQLIASVDNPSVTETLRQGEKLVSVGADQIRVRIPRLISAVQRYFEEVVPRMPAPVIIIHQPAPGTFLGGPTVLGLPAEQIAELLAGDNVACYIASADMRFEARVRALTPPGRFFWTGNGSLLLAGVSIGCDGACMMLGNVAPQACHDVLQLALAGQLNQARERQTRLLQADHQILSRGAAGLKAALSLLGYTAGRPRAPAAPCTASDIAAIRVALQQADLLT